MARSSTPLPPAPPARPRWRPSNPEASTAPADGAGDYGPVFLTDGSYDVTASADGFDPATVDIVSVFAGITTTQDFSLARPVLDAAPCECRDARCSTSGSADETLHPEQPRLSPLLDWSLAEMPPIDSANPLSMTVKAGPIEIEAELADQMRSRGSAGYIIDFRERPDLSPALSMGWDDRGASSLMLCGATATRTQARVRSYLEDHRVALPGLLDRQCHHRPVIVGRCLRRSPRL